MAVSGVSIGDKLIIKAGGPAVHLLRVSSQHLTRLCLKPRTRVHRAAWLFIAHDRWRF
jgi:hypothetical protein